MRISGRSPGAPKINTRADSDFDCRFRRSTVEGASWRKGRLLLVVDGSVSIADSTTGGVYTVPVEAVQVKVRGPKGGVKWESL